MLDKVQKSFILPPGSDPAQPIPKQIMGGKQNGTKCNAQANVGF
jgi:hypothetical protein